MSTLSSPMNAALNELRFTIPLPILEKVFIQRSAKWRQKHHSLNERIMEEVIRPRVFQDCNIAYGQVVEIDLTGCEREHPNAFTTIFRIPPELTQGRSILSALNIVFGIPGVAGLIGGYSNPSASAISAGAQAIANASGSTPITSTHNVSLIGENTIMIRDSLQTAGNMYLRCVVENDEHMTHLHYKIIPTLKRLVTQAVKSYIYNVYMIEMNMAELVGGQELGEFKNIISEYRDAEQIYQEMLKSEYPRAAVSTDYPAMNRYIKAMTGGFR